MKSLLFSHKLNVDRTHMQENKKPEKYPKKILRHRKSRPQVRTPVLYPFTNMYLSTFHITLNKTKKVKTIVQISGTAVMVL